MKILSLFYKIQIKENDTFSVFPRMGEKNNK